MYGYVQIKTQSDAYRTRRRASTFRFDPQAPPASANTDGRFQGTSRSLRSSSNGAHAVFFSLISPPDSHQEPPPTLSSLSLGCDYFHAFRISEKDEIFLRPNVDLHDHMKPCKFNLSLIDQFDLPFIHKDPSPLVSTLLIISAA